MRLKIVSARKVIKALESNGFKISRQSGSHIILVKIVDNEKRTVVVPKHDELAKGTLLSIISQSGSTKDEFMRLLE